LWDADLDLLEAVAELLSAPDRKVLKEADGYEALRVLVEKPVDLLITDVKMSGITGFTLARLAKLVRPNLRILYTAGYDCKAANLSDIAYGPVLQKPFRNGQMLQAVSAILFADQAPSPRERAAARSHDWVAAQCRGTRVA